MPKIFVVEDDANIRELILYALSTSEFEAVGFERADIFNEVIAQEGLPNLLLLDIMLPDKDGLQLMKEIRQQKETEHLPIILLTAKSSEYDRVKGLDLGADDYIVKPFSVLELLARIRTVLRRLSSQEVNQEEVIQIGEVALYPKQHRVQVKGETTDLTYKEFSLLQLLLEHKGIVFSREQIMLAVWGTDFQGESRTVDVHIKTLRQKLKDQSGIIQTIRNVGYKVDDQANA